MSKLARAIDILEAINEHLQGGAPLYPGSQILEEGVDIADAIKHCLGPEEEDAPVVPRSQRVKIWRNQWDNWNGYMGKRRVIEFGLDEQKAREWLASFPEESHA